MIRSGFETGEGKRSWRLWCPEASASWDVARGWGSICWCSRLPRVSNCRLHDSLRNHPTKPTNSPLFVLVVMVLEHFRAVKNTSQVRDMVNEKC